MPAPAPPAQPLRDPSSSHGGFLHPTAPCLTAPHSSPAQPEPFSISGCFVDMGSCPHAETWVSGAQLCLLVQTRQPVRAVYNTFREQRPLPHLGLDSCLPGAEIQGSIRAFLKEGREPALITAQGCAEQLFACHRHPLAQACAGLPSNLSSDPLRSASRGQQHSAENLSTLVFPWCTWVKPAQAENQLPLGKVQNAALMKSHRSCIIK